MEWVFVQFAKKKHQNFAEKISSVQNVVILVPVNILPKMFLTRPGNK